VAALRQQGFEVWGYEPTAPETGNFVVKSRQEISARFDGIFSNNVIEHFRAPVEQFADFKAILKPGGVMAHSSPCYEYSHDYTRFHTLFLTGRSPFVLAERAGFKATRAASESAYINFVFEAL
jgi:2-polyprenyl-3-methyl-5-hydroxy-6-metoxy-1,4-benzoquinol methylase